MATISASTVWNTAFKPKWECSLKGRWMIPKVQQCIPGLTARFHWSGLILKADSKPGSWFVETIEGESKTRCCHNHTFSSLSDMDQVHMLIHSLRNPLIHTLFMTLPSTKITLDPQNSFTFGFTWTRPEMIRAGRLSFTTGICAKNLPQENCPHDNL